MDIINVTVRMIMISKTIIYNEMKRTQIIPLCSFVVITPVQEKRVISARSWPNKKILIIVICNPRKVLRTFPIKLRVMNIITVPTMKVNLGKVTVIITHRSIRKLQRPINKAINSLLICSAMTHIKNKWLRLLSQSTLLQTNQCKVIYKIIQSVMLTLMRKQVTWLPAIQRLTN